MPANTEINPHNWIVIEKKGQNFFCPLLLDFNSIKCRRIKYPIHLY